MAFQIPTMEDVLQRTRQSFKSAMPNSDPWLWPNNIAVSAKVIGERIWEVFHRLDFVQKQAFPLTATGEYLDRHAQAYGLTRGSATFSVGDIVVTGGTPTTIIPAGTVLENSDGIQYRNLSPVTLDSTGGATFEVEALEAGVAANMTFGTPVFFLSALIGLPAEGSVSLTRLVGGGSDLETDESLRGRLLSRLQTPPHAGSKGDYERWAQEIDGVTRVWVSPRAYGPGSVGIWFAMDDSYPDGVPSAADVSAVQSYIDSQSPVGATVTVSAPVPEPIKIHIKGLTPYNQSVIDVLARPVFTPRFAII